MILKKYFGRIFSAAATLAITLLFFQNCAPSQDNFSSQAPSSMNSSSSAGGGVRGSRSCSYPGYVEEPGVPCRYAPTVAQHGQTASANAVSGGIGTISATCVDGAWKAVHGTCDPIPPMVADKKSCSYPGYVEEPGVICKYASAVAMHGQTTSVNAVSGGTGFISGTCNDGTWENVKFECTP